MTQKPNNVSRRDFARIITGTVAGGVVAGCAPSEKPKVNTPSGLIKDGITVETAVLDLEKQLNIKLTDGQRQALPHALKDIADTSANLRKFPLQDGGNEPGTLFTPAQGRR